jgi:hypothetical protein
MSDSHKRPRRTLKPGIQARQKVGRPATAAQLRQIFIHAAIEQREVDGDLTTKIVYNVHVDPPLQFEPPCTHSQRLAYFDQNHKKVAEVHYYVRPDGTIGASGFLDPKEVLHQGIRYFYDRA